MPTLSIPIPYRQDVADLAEEAADEVVESKGSERLGKRVESMLKQIDETIGQLDPTQLNLSQHFEKLVHVYTIIIVNFLALFANIFDNKKNHVRITSLF